METILHDRLPVLPWMDPRLARLPGVLPLDPGRWIEADEAYAAQMRLRRHLIGTRRAEVIAGDEDGPAARETLAAVRAALPRLGYAVAGDRVTGPDGVVTELGADTALAVLGRILQQDTCLLESRDGGPPVLTAAVLCFPASWTLSEKIGRPMAAIHRPVASFAPAVAARVQRLFDGLRPGRGLWRANALLYDDPALFQPRREAAPRTRAPRPAGFVRSERQTLVRLPGTGAVVFGIHTRVVPRERIDRAALDALEAAR